MSHPGDEYMPQRTIAPDGPPVIDLPRGLETPMLIGAGVIGGLVIASWGFEHLFREGLTSPEKKGLIAITCVFAGIGLAGVWGLEKQWYVNILAPLENQP